MRCEGDVEDCKVGKRVLAYLHVVLDAYEGILPLLSAATPVADEKTDSDSRAHSMACGRR